MTGKLVAVGLALGVTLAAPFLLRPQAATNPADADAVVAVVTPHNESIRGEFARAFAKHMITAPPQARSRCQAAQKVVMSSGKSPRWLTMPPIRRPSGPPSV